MPGLIITEFENVEMEPDKGTIDQNKSNQLIESSTKKRYKNVYIGDDDEYIDASKKNIDKSDVKGGVKGGEPRGNELEKINKIQQGDNCKTDNTDVNIIKKEDILQGEQENPPPDQKKQILGVDPNKCHIADDSGLNELQKEIIFSAVYFMLLQNEYDRCKFNFKIGKTTYVIGQKRPWEAIGNEPKRGKTNEEFAYGFGTETPLYPLVTPLEYVCDFAGYNSVNPKSWFSGATKAETAWCGQFNSAIHFRALIEVDYIPDNNYVQQGDTHNLHVPYFMSKYSQDFAPKRYKNPYTIPSEKLNKGTIYKYSAGAEDCYSAQIKKGCPGGNTPKPGSLFYRPKSKAEEGSGHTGVVVYVDENKTMYTIEGNAGNDCSMKKYTAQDQITPVGTNNLKGNYKDQYYYAYVWNWDKIKWKGKSKGLDLTKPLSPYHPVMPFTDPKHIHLNKVWTNPLELIKALKGTFWDYGSHKASQTDR